MADRLQHSETQFMKSDESAFSIVPSRLSMSTGRTSIRDSISSYSNMVYRRLSFEDDLFTARVYKRNYRNKRLQRHRGNEYDLNHETTIPQPNPPNNVHLIRSNFKPSWNEELYLRAGQLVRLLHVYDDGWVKLPI